MEAARGWRSALALRISLVSVAALAAEVEINTKLDFAHDDKGVQGLVQTLLRIRE